MLNLVIALIVTLVLRAMRVPSGTDQTAPADYYADVPSEQVTRVAQRTTAGAEAGTPGSPGLG